MEFYQKNLLMKPRGVGDKEGWRKGVRDEKRGIKRGWWRRKTEWSEEGRGKWMMGK